MSKQSLLLNFKSFKYSRASEKVRIIAKFTLPISVYIVFNIWG